MTTDQNTDIPALLEKGLELHKTGQFPQAEEIYRDILNRQPDHADALHYLGLLAVIGGEVEKGIELVGRAISINPENAAAHSNLGNMLRDAGRLEDAMTHLRRSIDIDLTFASTHADLGRALMDAGQLDDAAAALQKAVELDNQHLESLSNLGLIHLSQGNAAAASDHFSQAIAVNAELPDLFLNHSLALQELGNFDEALEQINRALALDADQVDYVFNQGTIYQDMGRIDDAIEAYERAVKLDKSMFQARCNLGALLEGQDGRLDDAIDHYKKALAIEPNVPAVLVNLGNALQARGDIDEALENYEKAFSISPDPATEIMLRQLRSRQLPRWHFPMLADDKRNKAYQDAIEKVVTPTSNVLDIGTGSGLLAMMAARAGASSVTACELSSALAVAAKKIIGQNGFADKIKVIEKKSNDLIVGEDITQRADVIIAEVFDSGLLREGALPTLRHAMAQLAVPSAKVIPGSATVKGKLVSLPVLRRVNPVRDIAGFDLSVFDDYRNPYAQIQDLNHEEHQSLSDVFTIATYDFAALKPKAATGIEEKALRVKACETGTAHAVVFWFDLTLADGIVLSSGPDDGHSHWGQAVQFFDKDIEITAGADVPLTVCLGEMQITFKV